MRAIVCGAGVAGLSLAWWLDQAGWEVLLIEKAPELRDDGYMIDFFGAGYDVAERMGLLPDLKQIHYPIPEIMYVDQQGRRVASLDYDVFCRLQNGRLLNFMHGDLVRMLFKNLSQSVAIRFNRTIDAVEAQQDGVEVLLDDGRRESGDLLVGADGTHSRVRELVFGAEQQFLRYLGFHTAAYTFEDQALRRELQGSFRNITAPDREAGFYPIRGEKVAAFFVHRTAHQALSSSPREALESVYGNLGWLVPAALQHCGNSAQVYYDQVAQIVMPQWSRGRVTLVGDACHAVSLLAGQGASTAMAGAYVLAHALQSGVSIEERLARYEDYLKPIVERTQQAGRRTADWIVPPTRWRIAVRNTALRIAGFPGLSWLLRPALTSGTARLTEPGWASVPHASKGVA
jgi:2-polyprenyl-6-methoxyphenol hydroxylase-like FAD-dependent oxidoreductase